MAFRHVVYALATVWAATSQAQAKQAPVKAQGSKEAGFHLDRLPQGKNVTINRPATTFVPLSSSVSLTATDMPQSVSLKPINLKAGGTVAPLRVSIMDKDSGKLQYVELKPGTPFLYNFKELGSITVVPTPLGGTAEGLSLQIESDKPLEIAH